MAKILLITDAWQPQTNGVVTNLVNLVSQAKSAGDDITVFSPNDCKVKFPLPWYKEIEISAPNKTKLKELILKEEWNHIHVATLEGTIGTAASKILKKYNIRYSASCHTKFPEFVNQRLPFIKIKWGWEWMRKKYQDAAVILVPSQSMKEELRHWGFERNIVVWTRGIDRNIFEKGDPHPNKIKTILCVSRVSHEKGLGDFCKLNIPETKKVLIGDGPYLKTLKKKYPDMEYAGKQTGKTLASYYKSADVFVFPSKVDTFGVVMIESMACGTPVAAYPVTGPNDIVEENINGALNSDLHIAVEKALKVSRTNTYHSSLIWTWENCYKQFKESLPKI